MAFGAARRLTDRQRAVMERIDRRVPIKVIAQELGVSETRINQHIRALKDVYKAGSLGALVENYRAALPPEPAETPPQNDVSGFADAASLKSLSEAAYINSQINPEADLADFDQQDDPGRLVLSDAVPLASQAPWLRPGEPRVVFGVLDGEHAVLARMGVIVGIASGILASVVLAITAATTLSEATDGKADYSAENRGVTDGASATLETTDGQPYSN